MGDMVLGLNESQDNLSLDKLQTENVDLISIAIDKSGSMSKFSTVMNDELQKFKRSIIDSKEADSILVSRIDFNGNIDQKGYKTIHDFDESYSASGGTALYDAIIKSADNLIAYMKSLKDNGNIVKAVFSVFSDGEDMSSKSNFQDAKRAVEILNQLEITTSFICFGTADNLASSLGFKNILNVGSSESDLRHAFDCLSKSVISASKGITTKDNFFVD